jgi:hypothetical protein
VIRPLGDAYALGVDEGTKILENTDYVDQMNISVLPGATELINNLKSGQVTEERISQIANLYFPVAAVKAGDCVGNEKSWGMSPQPSSNFLVT